MPSIRKYMTDSEFYPELKHLQDEYDNCYTDLHCGSDNCSNFLC